MKIIINVILLIQAEVYEKESRRHLCMSYCIIAHVMMSIDLFRAGRCGRTSAFEREPHTAPESSIPKLCEF